MKRTIIYAFFRKFPGAWFALYVDTTKNGKSWTVNVASISEILGHSDKAVTLRMYTHTDEESKKRASNIYRSALRNAGLDYAKDA